MHHKHIHEHINKHIELNVNDFDAISFRLISYHQHDTSAAVLTVVSGFIEFITRVACHGGRLGSTPRAALEMVLHFMNGSSGKAKHAQVSRKGLVGRNFVFS